jgi:hypothetical protein
MHKDFDDRVKWSVIAGGAGLVAMFVARKGLEGGWRWWAGDDPPENPADPQVTWGHALLWAGATGAAMALARLLALRGSAAGWKALKGTLPPA